MHPIYIHDVDATYKQTKEIMPKNVFSITIHSFIRISVNANLKVF